MPQAKTHLAKRFGEFCDYRGDFRFVIVNLFIASTRLALLSLKTNVCLQLGILLTSKEAHCLFNFHIFYFSL